MSDASLSISGWERALMAAEKVKERLRRATQALDNAGVPYAVAGGNAVAEWVGRVDEDAVRNTRDVDILLRRADLPAAQAALEAAGFQYHRSFSVNLFIDGPQGKASSGGGITPRMASLKVSQQGSAGGAAIRRRHPRTFQCSKVRIVVQSIPEDG